MKYLKKLVGGTPEEPAPAQKNLELESQSFIGRMKSSISAKITKPSKLDCKTRFNISKSSGGSASRNELANIRYLLWIGDNIHLCELYVPTCGNSGPR